MCRSLLQSPSSCLSLGFSLLQDCREQASKVAPPEPTGECEMAGWESSRKEKERKGRTDVLFLAQVATYIVHGRRRSVPKYGSRTCTMYLKCSPLLPHRPAKSRGDADLGPMATFSSILSQVGAFFDFRAPGTSVHTHSRDPGPDWLNCLEWNVEATDPRSPGPVRYDAGAVHYSAVQYCKYCTQVCT